MGRTYIVDGKKRCRGPKHCGAWVPLSNFHFHRTGKRAGKPFTQCKDCINAKKLKRYTGNHGYVPLHRIEFAITELINRIGKTEMRRRTGISYNFFYRMERHHVTKVRKETARRILMVLLEVRTNNEVRHPKSIHHGAAQRGKPERTVAFKPDGRINDYAPRKAG